MGFIQQVRQSLQLLLHSGPYFRLISTSELNLCTTSTEACISGLRRAERLHMCWFLHCFTIALCCLCTSNDGDLKWTGHVGVWANKQQWLLLKLLQCRKESRHHRKLCVWLLSSPSRQSEFIIAQEEVRCYQANQTLSWSASPCVVAPLSLPATV